MVKNSINKEDLIYFINKEVYNAKLWGEYSKGEYYKMFKSIVKSSLNEVYVLKSLLSLADIITIEQCNHITDIFYTDKEDWEKLEEIAKYLTSIIEG